MEYKPQKLHTYSVMMRQAILQLNPSENVDELQKSGKNKLRARWCELMNKQQNNKQQWKH